VTAEFGEHDESDGFGEHDDTEVRVVLHVAKTHLDVGFTDLAAAVRRRYLDDFFPRALEVAEQLRACGGPARLRWTTGSWILTEALDAADPRQRRRLDTAIEQGDLCWHALPFTTHTEYADRSLLQHGLSLSADLDRRYGHRTRAAKMTDVPGHTRGLVSLLADAGVDLLHIGVNPVAAAPRVPLQFRWRDTAAAPSGTSTASGASSAATARGTPGAAPEVSVMYQPGGYGDVQIVAGTDVAVSVDLTGDNLGPRGADEVVATFEALAQRFPRAEVRAATFDDVAEVMAAAAAHLPVLTEEIGDSWIHGTGSDPQMTAGFRALSRTRRSWFDDHRIDVDDPGLRRASTRLLLVAEHTWGMDQKTHWPDVEHWSVEELASVRAEPATQRFESSWREQRDRLHEFVDELARSGHPGLAAEAADALAATAAVHTPTDHLTARSHDETIPLGPWQLQLDDSGAVVGFVGADGRRWASDAAPLLQVGQRTFDAQDYERWYRTYNSSTTPPDEWWARWDNTKPGLEHTAARSQWWSPTLVGAWSGDDEAGASVVIDQRIDAAASDPISTPELWRTTLRWDRGEPGRLRAELCWFALRAARWPTAMWWRVAPLGVDPAGWTMTKLDEQVSPFDVVAGGGRTLHVADRLIHSDGPTIDLIDVGLVAPGEPRLLEWDDQPIDLSAGWHLCLLANLWGTNFPMWNEGDGRCRITLELPVSG